MDIKNNNASKKRRTLFSVGILGVLTTAACSDGATGSATTREAARAVGASLDASHPWGTCVYQAQGGGFTSSQDPPSETCAAPDGLRTPVPTALWRKAYEDRLQWAVDSSKVSTNNGPDYDWKQVVYYLEEGAAPWMLPVEPGQTESSAKDKLVRDIRELRMGATPDVYNELFAEEDALPQAIIANRDYSKEIAWYNSRDESCFLFWCSGGDHYHSVSMPVRHWKRAVADTQRHAIERDGVMTSAYVDRWHASDADNVRLQDGGRQILASRASDPAIQALLADLTAIYEVRDAITNLGNQYGTADAGVADALANFRYLKDGEANAKAAFQSITTDLSDTTATVTALLAAVAWARQESQGADEVILLASQALARVDGATTSFNAAMASQGDSLARYGIPRPVPSAAALSALGDALAYANARRKNAEDSAAALIEQLQDRMEVLIALAADQATRDTFAQTRQLKASTDFVNEATKHTTEATALPTLTPTLRAPLVTARYDTLTALLQLQPLCDPATVAAQAWRGAGCQIYSRNFSRATLSLTKVIPPMLRGNISLLQGKGIDVTRIQTAFGGGDIRTAATLSDAALLALDPLPMVVTTRMLTTPVAGATSPSPQSQTPVVAREAVNRPTAVRSSSNVDHASSGAEAHAAPGTPDVLTAQGGGMRVESLNNIPVQYDGDCIVGEPNVCPDRRRSRDFMTACADSTAASEHMHAALITANDKMRLFATQSTLDGYTVENLVAALGSTLSELDPKYIGELKDLVAAIAATPGFIRGRINVVGAEAQGAVVKINGKPMLGAQSLGRNFTDSALFIAPTFAAPVVPMPSMSTATGYDDPSVPYTALADKVIADLTASIRDRSRFLAIVRAWRANVAAIEPNVHSRAASAPTEAAAFSTAKQRVEAVITTYVDSHGWFLDTTVPVVVRNAIDGGLVPAAPMEGEILKEALNVAGDGTDPVVFDAVTALASAVSAVPLATLDSASALAVHHIVSGAAFAVSGGIASGELGTFCAVVTAMDGCHTSGTTLPLGTRVDRALASAITSSTWWGAAHGRTSIDAGPHVARVLHLTDPLSVADRQALVASVGSDALDHLADASLSDVQDLIAHVGNARVRALGAALTLGSLRDLQGLAFLHLGDTGRQQYAQNAASHAKQLSSLAGLSVAMVRSALTSAGFAKAAIPGGMGESWSNQDGSVVLLFPNGNEDRPGTPYALRSIVQSGSPIAILVDGNGRIVPIERTDADTQLTAWFGSPANGGRTPTSTESSQLDGWWLEATHPQLTP